MTDYILPTPSWKEFTSENGHKVVLNLNLAKSQGIGEEILQKIANIHGLKHEITERMKTMSPDDKACLHMFDGELTHYEFLLQDLWGFPRDASFHRFWLLPHCLCPKMDNEERYGTKYSIINCSCPVHGDK